MWEVSKKIQLRKKKHAKLHNFSTLRKTVYFGAEIAKYAEMV